MQGKFITLLLSSLLVATAFGGLIAKTRQSLQGDYDTLASVASALTKTSGALPVLKFSFLSKLLDCFGLEEVKEAIETFIRASSFPDNLVFNNSITNGTSNINSVNFKDGFFGNGQLACGQWVGNVTAASKTCLLRGDQTFFEQQLLNGNQTLLCGNTLSQNYVSYLNGWIKLKMDNSKDIPFDGYICIELVGCARGIFWKDGFIMRSPRDSIIISMNPHDSPTQSAA